MSQQRFQTYGTTPSPRADELRTVVGSARRAQRHGLDGLLAFHNLGNLDPWAVASTILHHSESVTPLVALAPHAMPPFTAAKLIHTLTRLHGRRIDVNLITGAAGAELEQLGEMLSHDERYDRLIEYGVVLRALLSNYAPLNHSGRFYNYRALRTNSALEEYLRPRFFVAGSSPAARRTVRAVADVAITHPEPVDRFATTFVESDIGIGIRIGLLARETDAEAWRVATARHPYDRRAELTTAMRVRSGSDWSRRLATLAAAEETYDEVYWTGAYRTDKGAMPLLVGSYDRVADYLDRYLALGVRTILLGGLDTDDDFRHAAVVLDDLRTCRAGVIGLRPTDGTLP
ncbi:LLM class flavin-dependent oxidoreductase [Kutzneria sp. 744]|uniref:LLM class flavin-dependent oxidoreductase n=1 Tax=Kutzneria sp. (strain 744) TaxID=345341 RepID=UPI0004BA8849|nr:LLM class flavin-dependent oxidoreductase [Kutzneria sp. 744]